MHIVQISKRNVFATKAATTGNPVSYSETDGHIHELVEGHHIQRRPVRILNYSLEFKDPEWGSTCWTFREVVSLSSSGQLIGESLLELLQEIQAPLHHLPY